MLQYALLALLAAQPAPDAEARVVEYLKANVTRGQRVVVSELYNEVFTAPDERAALDRLFNSFFKIPLFAAQYRQATGRAPSLKDIAEQFRFEIPGEADLMLRIMEADPRMPKFLRRDAASGEIAGVDVEAILKHPRFGKALERSIAGWEGKPAPAFSATRYDGTTASSQALAGKPQLLYFWFTNCPPCVKTAPLLVDLQERYAAKGLEIVALNADKLLELPFGDEERAAYARKQGFRFTLAHLDAATQEAYGAVSVYPSLFFVDKQGIVVKHFVSYQELPALDAAARLALN